MNFARVSRNSVTTLLASPALRGLAPAALAVGVLCALAALVLGDLDWLVIGAAGVLALAAVAVHLERRSARARDSRAE